MSDWLHGVNVPPLGVLELRRRAELIRSGVNLTPDEPFPVSAFLEHALPLALPGFDFEVVEEGLLDFDEACAYPDGCKEHPEGPFIKLTASVYDGAYAGHGRARLTVLHECAHVILHQRVTVYPRGPRGSELKPYRNSEWQATQLAAELLMPPESLARHKTLSDFCRRMGVSRQAATVRANKLFERGEIALVKWSLTANPASHGEEVRKMQLYK